MVAGLAVGRVGGSLPKVVVLADVPPCQDLGPERTNNQEPLNDPFLNPEGQRHTN